MPDFVPTDEQIDAAERALHRALSIGQQGGYRRVLAEVLVAVGPMVRRDALGEASTQIKAQHDYAYRMEQHQTDKPTLASEFWRGQRVLAGDLLARLGGIEKEATDERG